MPQRSVDQTVQECGEAADIDTICWKAQQITYGASKIRRLTINQEISGVHRGCGALLAVLICVRSTEHPQSGLALLLARASKNSSDFVGFVGHAKAICRAAFTSYL